MSVMDNIERERKIRECMIKMKTEALSEDEKMALMQSLSDELPITLGPLSTK